MRRVDRDGDLLRVRVEGVQGEEPSILGAHPGRHRARSPARQARLGLTAPVARSIVGS